MQQPTDPFQPPAPQESYHDKDAYMPPGVKKAMEEEGQQNPAGQPVEPTVMGAVPAPGSAVQPAAPQGPQPAQQPVAPTAPSRDQAYEFITNPVPAPKRSMTAMLPTGLGMRAALAGGGLLVLLIIILILRSVIGGGPSPVFFMSVLQDQQELIHLTGEASQQAGLSSNNQNFAATIQASVGSSQSRTIGYLTSVKQKINPKQISLKVSSTTDAQLSNAATAGDYNQTFQQIMQDQLNTYMKDLQSAYKEYTGKNARALLTDSYNQAQLLQTQLNSPAS